MDPTGLLAVPRRVELLDELKPMDCVSRGRRNGEGGKEKAFRTFSTSSRDLGSMGASLGKVSSPMTMSSALILASE